MRFKITPWFKKPVLNSTWSVKHGLLRHAYMYAKSTLFFSSNWSPRHYQRSPNALAAEYTDILYHCCSKFTQKIVPSLHKPTTWYMCTLVWSHAQVHVHLNGSVHIKSGGCWSCWAVDHHRDFSLQVHGILVINTWWSLSTDILKSRFHCTLNGIGKLLG